MSPLVRGVLEMQCIWKDVRGNGAAIVQLGLLGINVRAL